jgi:HEAT repeat protein/DNA replication protein DnaC
MKPAELKEIVIDLKNFQIHLYFPGSAKLLSLNFNSPSRKFYFSLIGFVINKMKEKGREDFIGIRRYEKTLLSLDEKLSEEYASKRPYNMWDKIRKSWRSSTGLKSLRKGAHFVLLNRIRRTPFDEEGAGKEYQCTEIECDVWEKLISFDNNHGKRWFFKFAVDEVGITLNEIKMIYDNEEENAWDRFIENLNSDVKIQTKEESKTLRELCLDEYLNKVAEKYRYLDLKYLRNLLFIEKPVKLEKIYIQLKVTKDYPKSEASHITKYMQFLSGTTEESIDKHEIIEKAHSIPYSIEQILNDALNNKDGSNKHMVLLGPPGSGKSTLLRYLAITIASGQADDWGLKGFIPIYIDLASFSRDNIEDLVEYAKNESAKITYAINREKQKVTENAIQQVLDECVENTSKDGKVVFLIDALDESGDKKKNIVKNIEKNSVLYKKAIFIVTSRTINYHVSPINNFECYLIEDLHLNDITQFITDWFQTISGEDAQYKANNLINKINKNLRLKIITTNPLYLTFLISLASDPDTIIPETRAHIFRLYFDKLIFNWEKKYKWGKKHEPPLLSDELFEGFYEICWIIHRSLFGSVQKEPSIDSVKKYLSTTVTINSQKLIDFWVNAGIFIKVKSRQHDEFLIPHHLSFIEYGFACKLVNLWENPKTNKKLWEDLKINLYNNHLYEPLMLFTGLLDNPNIFLKQVEELQNGFILNNLIFLSDAISEVRNKTLDKKIKINTLHKCIELWQSQDEVFEKGSFFSRIKLAQSIGKLGDKNTIPLLKNLYDNENNTVGRRCLAQSISELGNKSTTPLLEKLYKNEPDDIIKMKLAESIGKLGNKSSIPLLKNLCDNEPNDDVKIIILKSIGKLGDKSSITLLKNLYDNENNTIIKIVIAELIVELWDKKKLTISFLNKLYVNENDFICKIKLAELIGELGDINTIPLLKNLFENEPDENIKITLAESIGKLGNKKLAISLLINLFEKENYAISKIVLEKIIFELGDKSIMLLITKVSKLCNDIADDSIKKKFALIVGGLPDKKRLAISLLNNYYGKEHILLIKIKLIESIGELGNKGTIPLLEKLYKNEPDDIIKMKLAESIGKLGNKKLAISLLINLYEKENDAMSKLVLTRLIIELDNKSTIPFLEKLYENELDNNVKIKIKKLIGEFGNKKLPDLYDNIQWEFYTPNRYSF